MSAVVKKNFMKFNGSKYFRGNAHLVEILTFGEKKTPVFGVNKLDPEAKVARRHIDDGKVKVGTTVDINWTSSKSSDFNIGVPIKAFKLGGGFNSNVQHGGSVKLLNVFINEGPLKKVLNNGATTAKNYLDDEGNDGRIVSEIWIVLEADLANKWQNQGGGGVSAEIAGTTLGLDLSLGSSGTQTITISSGTTFAYKLHKVKKWKNGDIDDMEADYFGDQ